MVNPRNIFRKTLGEEEEEEDDNDDEQEEEEEEETHVCLSQGGRLTTRSTKRWAGEEDQSLHAAKHVLFLQVVSPARPVHSWVSPAPPFDEDDTLLFVVAIVLPSALLLMLVGVLVAMMWRTCSVRSVSSLGNDVVTTKYSSVRGAC